MLTTSTYEETLNKAKLLTMSEQLRLLEELAALVRQQLTVEPLHSLLELEGLGQEVWQGIDAQKYVDMERDSWIEDLTALIRKRVAARPQHRITEFKGLGKEIWQGVDVEEYIDQERNSWDS